MKRIYIDLVDLKNLVDFGVARINKEYKIIVKK
jgi:hypothetical protein